MSAGSVVPRDIGFPLRLGARTLTTPTRRLVTRRSGVLDRTDLEADLPAQPLPAVAYGCLLVRATPEGAEGAGASRVPAGFLRWVVRRGPRHYVRLEGRPEDYPGALLVEDALGAETQATPAGARVRRSRALRRLWVGGVRGVPRGRAGRVPPYLAGDNERTVHAALRRIGKRRALARHYLHKISHPALMLDTLRKTVVGTRT